MNSNTESELKPVSRRKALAVQRNTAVKRFVPDVLLLKVHKKQVSVKLQKQINKMDKAALCTRVKTRGIIYTDPQKSELTSVK